MITTKRKDRSCKKVEEEDQVREPIRKESDKLIFTMLYAREDRRGPDCLLDSDADF
jgi:hypothetical protein